MSKEYQDHLDDYNSKELILDWVHFALDPENAPNVMPDDRVRLTKLAERLVERGFWRGDISAAWMKLDFTMSEIPEMYP